MNRYKLVLLLLTLTLIQQPSYATSTSLTSETNSTSQTPVLETLTNSTQYIKKSIELLASGKQFKAETLVDNGLRKIPEDENLLFAKAVMRRSFWSKKKAQLIFFHLTTHASGYIQDASKLALELNNGEKKTQIMNFINLAKKHPDDIYLQWLLAIFCREYDIGALGAKTYENLLEKLQPGPLMMHHTYANILTEELKQYEKALEHRYIALAMNPGDYVLQGLGNTLRDMGRYEEAVDALLKAIAINPKNSGNHRALADVLRLDGKYEKAIQFYSNAIMMGNKNAGTCWYHKGVCQKELGDWKEARLSWKQAVRQGDKYANKMLADCYFYGRGTEKDLDKAYQYYQAWTEQKSPAEAMTDAGSWTRKSNIDESILFFEEALKLNPTNWKALNGLAWCYCTAKEEHYQKYEEAVHLAKASIASQTNLYNCDTLAVAYQKLGMPKKAKEARALYSGKKNKSLRANNHWRYTVLILGCLFLALYFCFKLFRYIKSRS